MTCTHVLGLIDAGAFADHPRAHLDAAREHAERCATCGPAWRTAAALTSGLTTLPQPAAPPHLAASVLARIARIEPTVGATADETAISAGWSACITALGALVVLIALLVSMPTGDSVARSIVSPRFVAMRDGLFALPSTAAGALAIAAGLFLYVAGLFGALRYSRSRRMP